MMDLFGEDCALGERTITRDYLTEAQDRADSPERQMPVSYVCVCIVEADVTLEKGRLCLRQTMKETECMERGVK